MYNPKSMKAEEFISHEEILDTLRYACLLYTSLSFAEKAESAR